MARCLVTGGAGFIGSHIAERLISLGHQVTIFDDFSTGKRSNLDAIKAKVSIFEASVCNAEAVVAATKNADYVFHLAAFTSVPGSIENPSLSHKVNSFGTLNVFSAAKENRIKRVIFSSSSAVYGDSTNLPLSEDAIPKPLSPYGLQKYEGETYARLFFELYSLEAISLRYFNVYGPRQDPNSAYAAVIPKFIKAVKNQERPKIFGDGTAFRDFIYIDDVVQANILAMDADRIVCGKCYNIGSGTRTTISDLVEALGAVFKTGVEPEHGSERQGDIKCSVAAIERAKHELSFSPEVTLEEGLARTVAGQIR